MGAMYERKAYTVHATLFDGTFDLGFLHSNERVTGDGGKGGCEVHRLDSNGDAEEVIEVPKGHWIVRDEGRLIVVSAGEFSRLYASYGIKQ